MNSGKQSTNLQMTLREVNRVGEVEKNVPKLRFKGYEDAWEQRKLSDASIINPKSEIPTSFKYVDLESVLGTSLLGYKIESKESAPSRAQRVAKKGDIFYQTVRPYQKNNYYFYLEEEDYVFSTGYAQIRPNCSGLFLFTYLQLDDFVLTVLNNCTGTSYPAINSKVLSNLQIRIPQILEQEKIGVFFNSLENLITLHQRKYDALKSMKKALLSKMFPKDGEDVPEIRFKGFTDAWEQRKLGEVAKYRNGKAHEQSVSENGKYVIVNSKFVSTNGEVQKFSCEQIEPLFKNEIAFVLSDVPNGRAIARTFLIPHDDKYTLNQRIAGITPNETTDCYFLHLLMNRNHYFLRFDDGVKQTNLSVNDVMEFSTYYPLYEEQQLCGQFFQKIDNLITLHQRKLEELKNMKKTLLQQMFV